MSTTPVSRTPESFEPQRLGEMLRYMRKEDPNYQDKPFVTLLVGAGFSVSAGVPAASTIVAEMRGPEEKHPFLVNAGATPERQSDYAFLMEKLGSPQARAARIRGYVNRARDAEGRLKVNWGHLLLATLVKHGYIRRILTTNFDPLIVEALAIMGQPIRTFDLNSNGHFYPGTLDDATVIYLHGQMHSLFLANSPEELEQLKVLYPPALQEAVQDSVLIVLGYSGDCDPVLDALTELPSFPLGLYWSQYSSNELRPGVKKVFQKHGTNCKLCQGVGADEFMVKMVNHGMKLDLPDEVLRPFTAARNMLERITAFPIDDYFKSDITQQAIDLLKRAESSHSSNTDTATSAGTTPPGHSGQTGEDGDLALQLDMAAINQDWQRFDKLRKGIEPNPKQRLSQVVGNGLLLRSEFEIQQGNSQSALACLTEVSNFGVSPENEPWISVTRAKALRHDAKNESNLENANRLFGQATEEYAEAVHANPVMHEAYHNWGNALCDWATFPGNSSEAKRLFAQAGEKYSEAVRIKPDKHEAFTSWGTSLFYWAKLLGKSPEAERLFAQATEKYAEAVRTKPDKHEAFYNWGVTLYEWAKLQANIPDAARLFAQAGEKYAEAVRIKPDKHEAFNNWGVALCEWAKLEGNTPKGMQLLAQAEEKYAETVRLKPDYYAAINNWIAVLLYRATLQENAHEREPWLEQAADKYVYATRLRPNDDITWFNWACVCALRNNVGETIAKLEKWREFASSPSRTKIDSDSDFDRVRNLPEFQAFLATLPRDDPEDNRQSAEENAEPPQSPRT